MFPLKMVIFHSYVSLPGGMCKKKTWPHGPMAPWPHGLAFFSLWATAAWLRLCMVLMEISMLTPAWRESQGGFDKMSEAIGNLNEFWHMEIWNLWNLWNIDHYDCYILLHWFRYVSIMRWIFQRFFRPFSIHKTAPQAVTWALMTPASLTASMGPQIVQVIRWVSSFSIEIYGDFGDPPSLTLWLFNIAMENGPVIDGLPIKNGDFPWLC